MPLGAWLQVFGAQRPWHPGTRCVVPCCAAVDGAAGLQKPRHLRLGARRPLLGGITHRGFCASGGDICWSPAWPSRPACARPAACGPMVQAAAPLRRQAASSVAPWLSRSLARWLPGSLAPWLPGSLPLRLSAPFLPLPDKRLGAKPLGRRFPRDPLLGVVPGSRTGGRPPRRSVLEASFWRPRESTGRRRARGPQESERRPGSGRPKLANDPWQPKQQARAKRGAGGARPGGASHAPTLSHWRPGGRGRGPKKAILADPSGL